jgi:hypothetical protein
MSNAVVDFFRTLQGLVHRATDPFDPTALTHDALPSYGCQPNAHVTDLVWSPRWVSLWLNHYEYGQVLPFLTAGLDAFLYGQMFNQFFPLRITRPNCYADLMNHMLQLEFSDEDEFKITARCLQLNTLHTVHWNPVLYTPLSMANQWRKIGNHWRTFVQPHLEMYGK